MNSQKILDIQDLSDEATYSLAIANTTSGNAKATLTITTQNDDVASRVAEDLSVTATGVTVEIEILNK